MIKALFEIDTGSTGGVSFNTPFSVAQNLLEQTPRKAIGSTTGLGGEAKEFIGRLSSLQFGNVQLREPIAAFPQVKSGGFASTDRAGLIGGQVFSRFKVIFDYSRNQIILEPNSRLNELFEADMSAIEFRYEGANFKMFRVISVQENSPAAESGLQKDDVVIAIDEQNVQALTADDVRKMFRQEGRIYQIRFFRNGEPKTATLTTRRLL